MDRCGLADCEDLLAASYAAAETANPSNLWTGLTPSEIAAQFGSVNSTTREGFTGHEMLDSVGLIHMNARLYDPVLGRFIQADTMVEDDATQGLNRYSYCLNNPLSRTDPSGNLSFRQVIGLAIGIAFSILSHQYWLLNNLWASFAVAVGGGFTSAFIATGSLKAGLWGALSAAVFWGIGTGFSKTGIESSGGICKAVRESSGASVAKVAAHAAAGGTLNVLQGGKFGHGFLSAGVTEALSPAIGAASSGGGAGGVVAGTVASAVVGGTVSELSGGKFGNGAQTGAFQYLFNRTVHEITADLQTPVTMGVHTSARSLSDDVSSPYDGHAWIALYNQGGDVLETWSVWQPGYAKLPESERNPLITDVHKNIELLYPTEYGRPKHS